MKLVLFVVRLVLSLRYKIKIKWTENLQHNWPILILPNHVALVDPRIMISFLWKYLKVSPVASEKYYSKPVLKQVMDLVWTVPIWEMENWASSEEVKKVFWAITNALKNWKNILIYPSGQIYRQWYESIKWKQSVYNIVNQMPESTKVVWVRIRWLWGSIWSKAWDNWETTFWQAYLKCIWYVMANFTFFVPKRKVNIEIQDLTEVINSHKEKNLNEFNSFLERFYNSDKDVNEINENEEKIIEPINYIKHYFYYDDVKDRLEPEIITGSEKELGEVKNYDLSEIDDDIKNKIKEKIWVIKEISIDKIEDNSKLILELFFDSLDLAEIKSYVQANFTWASNPPITDLKTVADVYVMAVWKSENEEKMKECNWEKDERGKGLLVEKLVG